MSLKWWYGQVVWEDIIVVSVSQTRAVEMSGFRDAAPSRNQVVSVLFIEHSLNWRLKKSLIGVVRADGCK